MCCCPSLQNGLSPWPRGAQGPTTEPNGGLPGGSCASHLPDPNQSQLCSWQEESQVWAQAMQKGTTSWLWQPTAHQRLPRTHCEPGAVPALQPRERGKSWPAYKVAATSSHTPFPAPTPRTQGSRHSPRTPLRTAGGEHCPGSPTGRYCQRSRCPRPPWKLGHKALARAALTLGHASRCSPVTRARQT